jgi:hypothetical protein
MSKDHELSTLPCLHPTPLVLVMLGILRTSCSTYVPPPLQNIQPKHHSFGKNEPLCDITDSGLFVFSFLDTWSYILNISTCWCKNEPTYGIKNSSFLATCFLGTWSCILKKNLNMFMLGVHKCCHTCLAYMHHVQVAFMYFIPKNKSMCQT